jgi:hypothetical protein
VRHAGHRGTGTVIGQCPGDAKQRHKLLVAFNAPRATVGVRASALSLEAEGLPALARMLEECAGPLLKGGRLNEARVLADNLIMAVGSVEDPCDLETVLEATTLLTFAVLRDCRSRRWR